MGSFLPKYAAQVHRLADGIAETAPLGDYNMAAARHQELLIQALRAAHEEAKAGSKAKTAFLASVSHELRTPMNGIIGFAEMIERDIFGTIGDARYCDYARDIVVSARRLRDILTDILEMARLESGRTSVQRETLDLNEVIAEAMAWVKSRITTETAPVEIRVVAGFPRLWTDRRHLRQILVNLVSNAMEFTPPTGSIAIFGYIAPNGDLEISVVDSGSGMTPDQVKAAVTRFGHVEDEKTRSSGGIGLGLPLAKSLCRLLGGTLRITSEPGEGTAVVLSFSPDIMRERAQDWGHAAPESPPPRSAPAS